MWMDDLDDSYGDFKNKQSVTLTNPLGIMDI